MVWISKPKFRTPRLRQVYHSQVSSTPALAPYGMHDASEVSLYEHSLVSVVDDDKSFRDSMRRLLKSLGYRAAMFASAGEFLASSQFSATACLVADVHMPGMTGVELYSDLVKTGRAMPTILVTAYPDDSVRKRMLEMGVACYLYKPLEEATLIDCLRSAYVRGNVQGNPG